MILYMEPTIDEIRRFWGLIQHTSTCWIWKGSPEGSRGYGRFSYRNRPWMAHRFSYELFVGSIPDDMQIDHLCGRTLCVNPNHLEVVTLYTNLMRGAGAGSVNARKTHCHRGHEFSDENTYLTNGGRQCLACKKQWSVDNAHKRRAIGAAAQRRYREKQKATKHESPPSE